MRHQLWIALVAGILAPGAVSAQDAAVPATPPPPAVAAAPTPAELPAFNRALLAHIKTFPADGTHGYWWPRAGESNYDGVTRDISLFGRTVLKGEEGRRTFCCGLTLEVFTDLYLRWLEAMKVPEAEAPIKPEQFGEFKRLWFVEEINGPGPSAALERFGLGRTIRQEEALPGDFVQIWRRPAEGKTVGSGHSVVFLDWVKDDSGKVTGFRYWSTQPSTKGIGEVMEYFAEPGGTGMAAEHTHWARVEFPVRTPAAP
jgi:hypothetical protein